MKNKAIIIGGGSAGLSAGYYSAINGYDTIVFERSYRPGGLVTKWSRYGHKVDNIPNSIYGHKHIHGSPFHALFEELDILDSDLYVDLDELHYIQPNGLEFKITQDLEKLKTDLIALSPLDEEEIILLIEDIKFIATGVVNNKKFKSFRYAQTLSSYVKKYNNPSIKFILSNIMDCAEYCPLFLIILQLAHFFNNELGIFKYGSYNIVERIVKKYINAGGELKNKTEIREIIIENNKAIGVITKNNIIYYADKIIWAGDYHSLMSKLSIYNIDYSDVKLPFEKWDISHSIVLMHIIINQKIDIPYLNFIRLTNPTILLEDELTSINLKNIDMFNSNNKSGKFALQIYFHSNYEKWANLKKNLDKYNKQKKELAKYIIEELSIYIPQLKNIIVGFDIATPHSFWRHTQNYKGATCGWNPSLSNLSKSLPLKITPIESLYLAGHWIIPGGGVSRSLLSGKMAIETMVKDDSKKFICKL